MRYHWGLGIGHIYTHQPTSTSSSKFQVLDNQATKFEDDQYVDLEVGENSTSVQGTDQDTADDTHESENPEFGLDDHGLEDWEDVETDSSSNSDGPDEQYDSEEDFVGM